MRTFESSKFRVIMECVISNLAAYLNFASPQKASEEPVEWPVEWPVEYPAK